MGAPYPYTGDENAPDIHPRKQQPGYHSQIFNRDKTALDKIVDYSQKEYGYGSGSTPTPKS